MRLLDADHAQSLDEDYAFVAAAPGAGRRAGAEAPRIGAGSRPRSWRCSGVLVVTAAVQTSAQLGRATSRDDADRRRSAQRRTRSQDQQGAARATCAAQTSALEARR